MTAAYGWTDGHKFFLSLFPAGSAHRSHNTYDTPEAVKAAADQAGLTLQWDDPAGIAAWIKGRSMTTTTTQSNGSTTVPPALAVEVIPPAAPTPAPAKPSMASGMNITPTTSIANNMVMAVQNLRTVSSRMSTTTAAINATVTKLNSKVDNLDAMRAALEELASKMDV